MDPLSSLKQGSAVTRDNVKTVIIGDPNDRNNRPGTPSGFGGVKYPLHDQEAYKGKVTFQAYEVIPPNISMDDVLQVKNYATEYAKNLTNLTRDDTSVASSNASGKSDAQVLSEQIAGKKQANATTSNVKSRGTQIIPIAGQKCEMYLPLAFSVNDGILFDNANLNQAGTGVLAGATSGSSPLTSLKAGIDAGLTSSFDFLKGSLAQDAARLAAFRLASKIQNEGIRNAASIAGQVSLNPNTRALFRGVNLREYTFQFKFMPKSAAEAEAAKNIIKFFRSHAYPDVLPKDSEIPLGYKYPNLFEIKISYNNARVGTKIKKCYLRNIQSTYNPTGMSFHADGNPAEIDITLSFVENMTINRSDVEGGY